jgi:Asp-tRNA(Asn)/Glu-tRNA(Gln) amidotransferase B subunit
MILQKIVFAFRALINSRIASTLNFKKKNFCNSNRDFYSENNNVSQVYTYIPKVQKKKM